jgi:hypothetical protein
VQTPPPTNKSTSNIPQFEFAVGSGFEGFVACAFENKTPQHRPNSNMQFWDLRSLVWFCVYACLLLFSFAVGSDFDGVFVFAVENPNT